MKIYADDILISNLIIENLGKDIYLSDMLENGIPNSSFNANDVQRVWKKIIEAAINSVK